MRTEFEKVSREVEGAFTEKARTVAEFLGKRVDDVFAPENGQLAKELERLFGAESAVAVQHQLRAVMTEQSARMREDLLKQFSSADAHNPLADFKAGTMAVMQARGRAAGPQPERAQRADRRAQGRGRQAPVRAREAARGRRRARALDGQGPALRGGRVRGDRRDRAARAATTATRSATCRGSGGRKGDVLVGVDGCAGPARGRIVFEAKNAYVPKNKALAELDAAMEQRDADYAVWVVPSEELLPGRGAQLREVNGDKLFVVHDPEDGSRLGARGRLRAGARAHADGQAEGDGLDAGALRTEVERALAAMDDVRRIKSQLTAAAGGIDAARRDPRRDGRPRARAPRADRRARRGRHRRRHAAAAARLGRRHASAAADRLPARGAPAGAFTRPGARLAPRDRPPAVDRSRRDPRRRPGSSSRPRQRARSSAGVAGPRADGVGAARPEHGGRHARLAAASRPRAPARAVVHSVCTAVAAGADRPAVPRALTPTSAGSSLPCRRSRPRWTAAMNFERLTSSVLRISSA